MNDKDFSDPFNAGQMVGMLVVLAFIEKNGGIDKDLLQDLKTVAAENSEVYLNMPTEDVFLLIDKVVSEINL